MYGFVQKKLRIVRISSENVRTFVRIFSKKFWPPCNIDLKNENVDIN